MVTGNISTSTRFPVFNGPADRKGDDHKYYEIKAKADETAEIYIYEQIGKDYWDDSGIGAKQFAEDLKKLGNVKKIKLYINSPGGNVFEGIAIYNLLAALKAEIEVYVHGVAASIASVIAMVGKVIMPENAMMMIHDPWTLAMGNADDMRKAAEMLDKVKLSIMSAYRAKTGMPDADIADLMADETWMTANEAKEWGFCDEVIEPVKIAASFDLTRFKKAPADFINKIAPAAPVRGKEKKEDVTMKCRHCGKDLVGGICPDKCEDKHLNASVQSAKDEAKKAEQERISAIFALGEQHKCMRLAQDAVRNGTSVEDFKDTILKTVYDAKTLDAVNPNIGMTDNEADQFSITRAIRNIAEFKPLDGIEREASEAAAKVARREPKGFFIPHDVMRRTFARNIAAVMNALSAGDATRGGYLIGTDVLVSDMIELLRNKTLVSQLGARTLGGLVGNIAIPRVTGGATAYWLPETGSVTPSDQTFGQLGLTPHRLVGDTAYSKELIMQTSLDVEAFVREDLMTVLAIARDLAAINGSGSNGEPQGIMGLTGIGSVTFGGAPTWAKVVDFETQVANANADVGSMAYLTTPTVRGKWKTTVKFANTAATLWENGDASGRGLVNGYRAEATKQVPGDKVIFGNWSDLILAEWAGIDVVVDPYSLKKTGQIEVTITLWCDNGVRHAGSFCVSSDSGAQ